MQKSTLMKVNPTHLMPVLFVVILFFISCKKEAPVSPQTLQPVVVTPTGLTPEQLKDSSVIYAKDIYLWNTQIPATFDGKLYADPNKIMEAIRPFSIETGFTTAVDRWSFAMLKKDWDKISAGMNSVNSAASAAGDFGFQVFFRAEGDLRVRLVERRSPSGLAGIERSWRVTKIDGSTNITTANASFIVDKVYNSTSTAFTFQKPDGSLVDISLNAAHYTEQPVYLDTVYQVNGKSIGYLVFNSFLGNPTEISNEFSRVFNRFASQGVSEMVVDLRYNGGGYVSVQEQLANYLIKPSANNGIMMKQMYNANNSQHNNTTLFNKRGSLNLDDVYFIVGRGTASASELLINNLKPYMEVKLIGASNTHGKPVGYFPIPVGEWYLFPVSFITTNKNGEGKYFNGIPVNAQIADGLDKNWGDITESSLASAIRNIMSGSYRQQSTEAYKESASVASGNNVLDKPFLKITIDARK